MVPTNKLSMLDIDKIKLDLIELKSELETLDSTDAGDTVVLDQARVGRLSRMDALQAQQMALEARRRRQLQLQKIEGALHRLDAGEYGYCFICHEEIDNRRLRVDPTSTRCMSCAEKSENGAPQ
jgi:DnaK suppressor protein